MAASKNKKKKDLVDNNNGDVINPDEPGKKENGSDKKYSKVSKSEIHAKHRQRVKENYRNVGIAGLQPHNVLEMLLFYCIPRVDTNEIAHSLINEFGSLDGVFDAPYEALKSIDGIGQEAATFLKFVPDVCRYYMLSKAQAKSHIINSKDAANYLKPFFINAVAEKFVVMYLDGHGNVIKCSEFTQNENDNVFVDMKTVVREAYVFNASGVVIAHNHPGGFAVPSNNDKVQTERLWKLLVQFNISLCEHIIFTNNDQCFCSELDNFKKIGFVFG